MSADLPIKDRAIGRPRKLLLLNHFGLTTICGTSVMIDHLLRVALTSAPRVEIAFESYETYSSVAELRTQLDTKYSEVACVMVVNAHIEVDWQYTEAVFDWCLASAVPAYDYAHDYWPHHRPALDTLIQRYRARLLGSTPFVAEAIEHEGYSCRVIDVGIPLPADEPPIVWPTTRVVAAVGRLVPRKRLPDVVRGFADADLGKDVQLYIRALPSNVFSSASDASELKAICDNIELGRLTNFVIDSAAGDPPAYQSYSAYVCASSYEGFSMTVVEAAYHGCPPLMSNIPPHRRNAIIMFGEAADLFQYPVGDCRALAALLRDEILSGRRKALIEERIDDIRAAIRAHWSLEQTARQLANVVLESIRG